MPRDYCHCSVFYPVPRICDLLFEDLFPRFLLLFSFTKRREIIISIQKRTVIICEIRRRILSCKKIEETTEIEEKWNIILYLSRNDLPFAIRAKNGERINWTTALINFTSRRAVMHAARLRVPVTR